MSAATAITFTPQGIGETEKALNTILDRLLAGTGLSEPQWVTLTLTAGAAGTADRHQLIGRVAGGLKVSAADAEARIAELAARDLLKAPERGGAPVTLTDAGQQLHAQIRGGTAEITQRLWGDLPAEDLASTGRVLSIVLDRANAELAGVL